MKFKHYLESITGVSIYPIITLLMFFGLFTILTIWAFRSRKQHFHTVSHLPLDGTEPEAERPL